MPETDNEMTFETAMRRLEEIVQTLENSGVSLEESLRLYKEGSQCSQYCRQKLEAAKHELEIWQENGVADISEPGGDVQ